MCPATEHVRGKRKWRLRGLEAPLETSGGGVEQDGSGEWVEELVLLNRVEKLGVKYTFVAQLPIISHLGTSSKDKYLSRSLPKLQSHYESWKKEKASFSDK